jgi:hypothetical protein
VKLIDEPIELISRRAGLDNVGEVAQAPVTVTLNPDTSPEPSAGMSPQDTKLGEGVHVRG